MNERYGRLYSLPKNLYLTGSPVLIVAGALLKDNQTNKVLAQLKFQNIGEKIIKAITVTVAPKDTADHPLGEAITYQYLDLCAVRDDCFGQRTAFPFLNPATRSYIAAVTEVIFNDNSIWKNDELNWMQLKEPQPLNTLCDDELELQFRLEYGSMCSNLLLEEKDIWHCVCGAVNHKNEQICHKCGANLAELRAIDLQKLQKKKEERVTQEKVFAQEQAAHKQQKTVEAEIQKKKVAKRAAKSLLIVGSAVAMIFVLCRTVKFAQNEKKYKNAEDMISAEQYESAMSEFRELGDFKDSQERVDEVQEKLNNTTYAKAEALADDKKYQDAMELFEALGNYKDSADRVTEMQEAITWKNVKFADSFLGEKVSNGVLDMSEEDYATIQNEMYLFGIPGRFSHGTTSSPNIVGLMDWVSSESVQSVEWIVDIMEKKYGDNCRVEYYDDANGNAYMWNDVDRYEYVILWKNTDGTIDIRWII